jgi:hypothetical protein
LGASAEFDQPELLANSAQRKLAIPMRLFGDTHS